MRQHKASILLLLGILAVGTALAAYYGQQSRADASGIDTSGWQRYSSFGISFSYPPAAEIIDERLVTEPVTVQGPFGEQLGEGSVAIEDTARSFTIDISNLRSRSYQETLDEYERGGNPFADQQQDLPRQRQVGAKTAYERLRIPDQPAKGRVLTVGNGELVYEILFGTSSADDWARNERVYEAFLRSVVFG